MPDILVPGPGIRRDELLHYRDTPCQIEIDHFDAVLTKKVTGATKIVCFAGDHLGDTRLYYRTGTEVAGYECKIERVGRYRLKKQDLWSISLLDHLKRFERLSPD